MPELFYLQVVAEGAGSAVGVNDVPLVIDSDGGGISIVRPINEWLMPDNNRLSVFLHWPETRTYAAGLARVRASVFIGHPAAEWPQPLRVLADFQWPQPDQPEAYPYTFAAPLAVRPPPLTTLWRRATQLRAVEPPDRAALVALVERFRAALLGADPQAAFGLVAERFADDARAYGKDPDRVRDVVLTQYRELMSEPGRLSSPLELQTAAFDVVADGYLVRVTRGGTEPAIRIRTAEDTHYGIDVYAAKLDGAWQLAR